MIERLLDAKKLSLVIDLDQTILHATLMPPQSTENCSSILVNNLTYYIRLRPGLSAFLQEMSGLFELHVYTMGTRQYAHQIVRLIDPTGVLVADRIVSREDVREPDRKRLTRIFPHSDRLVVVLDDRGDVWAWCLNLVMIRPFVWFTGTADIHRPETALEPESIAAVGDDDDELRLVMDRLRAIYSLFFSRDPKAADVKDIIASTRGRVLHGCRLVFSGLFPVDTPIGEAELCRMAMAYGAQVQAALDDQVTHLVCARKHSSKYDDALQRGIDVVRVEWLWESCWQWRRVDEASYRLGDEVGHAFDVGLLTALQRELDEEDTSEDDEDRKRTCIEGNEGDEDMTWLDKEVDDI